MEEAYQKSEVGGKREAWKITQDKTKNMKTDRREKASAAEVVTMQQKF